MFASVPRRAVPIAVRAAAMIDALGVPDAILISWFDRAHCAMWCNR
jgi:hypothetical protein